MADIHTAAQSKPVKRTSQFAMTMKQLARNPAAVVGLCILLFLVVSAILAPLIAPYEYDKIDVLNSFQPPSKEHWCGTDQLGRDIFTRLLYGARYSISMGMLATIFSCVIGMFVGAIAGFFGGAVDEVIMRVCDVFQSIPGMILNVALACALGAGFGNCILALSISGFPFSARVLRAQLLSIRKMEYIDAAGVINSPTYKIITKHMIPNCLAPLIVGATMGIGGNIQAAASLAYLGLGVQAPTPEWGAMLSEGRSYMQNYPWMCIFPGVCIFLTVLAFNLFGDGLRDALDPKQKK